MDMQTNGQTTPSGDVQLTVVRNLGDLRKAPASWQLRNWLSNRRKDIPKMAIASMGRLAGMARVEAQLSGAVYRRPTEMDVHQQHVLRRLLNENFDVRHLARFFGGECVDYGVLSRRLVTTAGVNYLVTCLIGTNEPELLKFHGYGTGSTAEAIGDTALVLELTTQYATDNTRPTGSQTTGGSANVYRSVGTLSPDATVTIAEHGLFTAISAGTLLDRSIFTGIPLTASADSLQTTYDFTIAGGN